MKERTSSLSLRVAAIQYGLDPMVPEIVLYQSQIYLTAAGLRKLATRAPSFNGLQIEPMVQDWSNNLFVVKATVWRKGCDYPFEDYGTADSTASNLNGRSLFEYAIAQARTRALRAAFAVPFPVLDEVTDSTLTPVKPEPPIRLPVRYRTAHARSKQTSIQPSTSENPEERQRKVNLRALHGVVEAAFAPYLGEKPYPFDIHVMARDIAYVKSLKELTANQLQCLLDVIRDECCDEFGGPIPAEMRRALPAEEQVRKATSMDELRHLWVRWWQRWTQLDLDTRGRLWLAKEFCKHELQQNQTQVSSQQ